MYCECVCLFAKLPSCIILKEGKNQLFQKTFSCYNTILNDCASTFIIERNSTVTRYLCYKFNIYRNHDPTYFVDVFVYSETSTLCNDKRKRLFTCYLNIHVRNYAGKPLESGFFARLTSYEYGLTVYSGLLPLFSDLYIFLAPGTRS